MFPAWFDFQQDTVVARNPVALRVYTHLVLTWPTIFVEPRDLKADGLATELGVTRQSIYKAFTLLVERGYMLEHGRRKNKPRRVQLAIRRPTGSPVL